MNDELKAKLLGYLAKLETAAGKVGECAGTEIPEPLKEYILWVTVEHTIYAVASAIPLLVWVCLQPQFRKWIEWAKKQPGEDPEVFAQVTRFGLLLLTLAVLFPVLLNHGPLAVKAYVAPRVVILEKLVSLTK